MQKPQRIKLSYHPDSSQIFNKFSDLPWAVYLDSCRPYSTNGRYDILTALPYLTLSTTGLITRIQSQTYIEESSIDPFQLVKYYLGETIAHFPDLPFSGGAIGYFSYDLARRIIQLSRIAQQDIHLPDMAIGLYDWCIVVDHELQQTWFICNNHDKYSKEIAPKILELLHQPDPISKQQFQITHAFQANFTKESYQTAFKHIQRYIYEGDCYQVNLAQRFTASFQGSPWTVYQVLRQNNPATYSAYFNLPEGNILSLSPERFLQVKNKQVETKPIKGTRPRNLNPAHDQQLAAELLNSKKDRAENLMIVDLLRNDLGKTCKTGSITVPQLFAIESFSAVHHLVSTITGELANNTHSLDLLRGCFPGGSITGTPKLRAMQIIEEIEPHCRSIYCGAVGYIGFDGNMDTNISIRTLICNNDKLYCFAGGGIVADSQLEEEYQETFDKVAIILNTLNQFA